MRTFCTAALILVVSGAASFAQAPKPPNQWTLGIPGFKEPKPVPVPSPPSPKLVIFGQLNQATCSVPLIKAQIQVDIDPHMTVPAEDPKDRMPKVTLPAPPCDTTGVRSRP